MMAHFGSLFKVAVRETQWLAQGVEGLVKGHSCERFDVLLLLLLLINFKLVLDDLVDVRLDSEGPTNAVGVEVPR